jgi:hypothetical protein
MAIVPDIRITNPAAAQDHPGDSINVVEARKQIVDVHNEIRAILFFIFPSPSPPRRRLGGRLSLLDYPLIPTIG